MPISINNSNLRSFLHPASWVLVVGDMLVWMANFSWCLWHLEHWTCLREWLIDEILSIYSIEVMRSFFSYPFYRFITLEWSSLFLEEVTFVGCGRIEAIAFRERDWFLRIFIVRVGLFTSIPGIVCGWSVEGLFVRIVLHVLDQWPLFRYAFWSVLSEVLWVRVEGYVFMLVFDSWD